MEAEVIHKIDEGMHKQRGNLRIAAGVIAGLATGVALTVLGSHAWVKYTYPNMHKHRIPDVSNVASGFAVPSKLEIQVKDVDGEGYIETYLVYKGVRYFLKENKGKPVVQDYYQ